MLAALQVFGYQLRGKVTNQDGEPIPYSSVYVEGTSYGVISNVEGNYFLELSNGTYQVRFQSLGYETKLITVIIDGANQVKNVRLTNKSLEEVVVESDREDPAYRIMRQVLQKKDTFLNQFDQYQCRSYIKASLDEYDPKREKDSTTGGNLKKTNQPP